MISMILQTAIDGLLLGGVYSTVAMGLSLAFGVMGIVNWSHGETLMIAMYISYALVTYFHFDPYITLFVNMVVLFAFGYFLQKFVFSSLMRKDSAKEPVSVLMSTAGLGMLLSNLATMTIGSKYLTTKTVYTGATLWVGDIMLSIPRMISFAIALVVNVGLYLLLQKTNWGRALRATSQDRQTAQMMGIPIERVFSIAFGISLALVGAAGALLSPNYAVYPTVGAIYSNRAFIVVVLGGKGNLKGALICGIIIGLIERLGALFFSEAVGQLLTFALFIVILLYKPQGIFSRRTAKA